MIYGKRNFEFKSKFVSSNQETNHLTNNSNQSLEYFYNRFQRQYATYFLIAILGPFTLFVLPCVFFVHQNYQIFLNLAYDVRPDLLTYLERERGILFSLISFAIISSSIFCYWITHRIVAMLANPLSNLERHIKQVSDGDLSSIDIETKEKDEFQSLTNTYSYFYRNYRKEIANELESLESLGLDPRDRKTYVILKNLIDHKRKQLGIKTSNPIEISSKSSEVDLRHRAS